MASASVSDVPASARPASDERWLVLKFGGTSVSKRERWDTIGQLADGRAAAENARVLVVVSALSGVTNDLQAISNGDGIGGRVDALVERHRAFCADDLGLDPDDAIGERLRALQCQTGRHVPQRPHPTSPPEHIPAGGNG